MKALDEIHQIMERIYEEEKNLSQEERLKKIHQESEEFLKERDIKLRRVSPKEAGHL